MVSESEDSQSNVPTWNRFERGPKTWGFVIEGSLQPIRTPRDANLQTHLPALDSASSLRLSLRIELNGPGENDGYCWPTRVMRILSEALVRSETL